jgi:hypothetical protein
LLQHLPHDAPYDAIPGGLRLLGRSSSDVAVRKTPLRCSPPRHGVHRH